MLRRHRAACNRHRDRLTSAYLVLSKSFSIRSHSVPSPTERQQGKLLARPFSSSSELPTQLTYDRSRGVKREGAEEPALLHQRKYLGHVLVNLLRPRPGQLERSDLGAAASAGRRTSTQLLGPAGPASRQRMTWSGQVCLAYFGLASRLGGDLQLVGLLLARPA